MKILDKYIFEEILKATIFGILLFIILWISPEILFKIVRKFIYGEIPIEVAIKFFFLEIPEILTRAIPVGLMLAGLFVFDRLSKDSELTIIRMSGVGTLRLFVPILFLSIIGVVASFIVYENLIPNCTTELKQIKGDFHQGNFVYVDKNKNEKPKQILIVGGFIRTNEGSETLYDIKLLKFSDKVSSDTPLMKNIITADYAEIHDDFWSLKGVTNYQIASNGVYEGIEKQEKINIFTPDTSKIAKKLLYYSTQRPREMTNSELHEYMKLLTSLEMNEELRFTLSKYYQRYAHSFGCILLAICGVLLGINRPREKRIIGFTLAAALIFSYYIFIPFLDMLAQMGTLPPMLSAWAPNLIILAAIIGLIKYKDIM